MQSLVRPYNSFLDSVFRLLDVALVVMPYLLLVARPGTPEFDESDMALIAGVALIFMSIAISAGVYQSWRLEPLYIESRRIVATWCATLAVALSIMIALGLGHQFVTHPMLLWAGTVPATLCVWRILIRFFLRYLRSHERNSRSAVVVGLNQVGAELAEQIESSRWTGLRVIGFGDDRHVGESRTEDPGKRRVLALPQLVNEARDGLVDVIFIALPLTALGRIRHILDQLADTTVAVYVTQDHRMFDLLHGRWFTLGTMSVLSVRENPFRLGLDGWFKRCEDIVIAVLGITIMLVPGLIIAALIKLTSLGPVFFRQRRCGLDGRPINVWKFRTMFVCEDGAVVKQATFDDPRVTPLGRLLRRSSLDELPQFLNVLLGNMSVVGPRPHALAHNEQYRALIPSYMLRHLVKPGITGLAQINGCRGETRTVDEMKARINYDLEYIKTWSLLLDIKIIIVTFFVGFVSPKSY